VTQQNIAAQNYAKLLKKMLESGGDVKVNKDKVTINYPTNAADGSLNPLSSTGQAGTPGLASGDRGTSGENLRQLNAPSTATATLGGNLVAPNPSSSPLDIPASDLAGLTPQDISAALGFKMKAEELGQQKIMDVAKNIIAERRLEIEQAKLGEEKQTADIKNYQYAVSQGYKGSFADFKNSTDTTTIKDYEYAVRQGYKGSYQDWRTEIAKAGGTNISIGEKVETARALGEVKNKAWFTSPEGMMADLDKLINTEDVQNQLIRYKGEKRAEAVSRIRENYIDSRITGFGGEILDKRLDGTTFVWKVKWPDGTISEVRDAH
jgi:hypothetical protein